jgi:NADH/NAD ratio-sensing transcriptional regulator Rex
MFNETNPSIEKTLIMTKLSKLKQYLKYLKELQASSIKEFSSDLHAWLLFP